LITADPGTYQGYLPNNQYSRRIGVQVDLSIRNDEGNKGDIQELRVLFVSNLGTK